MSKETSNTWIWVGAGVLTLAVGAYGFKRISNWLEGKQKKKVYKSILDEIAREEPVILEGTEKSGEWWANSKVWIGVSAVGAVGVFLIYNILSRLGRHVPEDLREFTRAGMPWTPEHGILAVDVPRPQSSQIQAGLEAISDRMTEEEVNALAAENNVSFPNWAGYVNLDSRSQHTLAGNPVIDAERELWPSYQYIPWLGIQVLSHHKLPKKLVNFKSSIRLALYYWWCKMQDWRGDSNFRFAMDKLAPLPGSIISFVPRRNPIRQYLKIGNNLLGVYNIDKEKLAPWFYLETEYVVLDPRVEGRDIMGLMDQTASGDNLRLVINPGARATNTSQRWKKNQGSDAEPNYYTTDYAATIANLKHFSGRRDGDLGIYVETTEEGACPFDFEYIRSTISLADAASHPDRYKIMSEIGAEPAISTENSGVPTLNMGALILGVDYNQYEKFTLLDGHQRVPQDTDNFPRPGDYLLSLSDYPIQDQVILDAFSNLMSPGDQTALVIARYDPAEKEYRPYLFEATLAKNTIAHGRFFGFPWPGFYGVDALWKGVPCVKVTESVDDSFRDCWIVAARNVIRDTEWVDITSVYDLDKFIQAYNPLEVVQFVLVKDNWRSMEAGTKPFSILHREVRLYSLPYQQLVGGQFKVGDQISSSPHVAKLGLKLKPVVPGDMIEVLSYEDDKYIPTVPEIREGESRLYYMVTNMHTSAVTNIKVGDLIDNISTYRLEGTRLGSVNMREEALVRQVSEISFTAQEGQGPSPVVSEREDPQQLDPNMQPWLDPSSFRAFVGDLYITKEIKNIYVIETSMSYLSYIKYGFERPTFERRWAKTIPIAEDDAFLQVDEATGEFVI